MIRIKILLGILVFGWIVSQGSNVLANDELVPENSPLYNELMQVALKWKNAVLNKNVNVLVYYALPEYKKNVASKLKNKNSDLYRIFFKDKESFYEILRKAKRLKIVLVKHKGLEKAGKGVNIYYYDEDRIKISFPLSIDEAQVLYEKGEIISVFFFEDEGQWFASYEFFG
jgi:hypothetical protein